MCWAEGLIPRRQRRSVFVWPEDGDLVIIEGAEVITVEASDGSLAEFGELSFIQGSKGLLGHARNLMPFEPSHGFWCYGGDLVC